MVGSSNGAGGADVCEAESTPARPPDRDEVRRFIERSCKAQGLPLVVEDPAVLERIATLLGDRPC